jgi:nucleolar MIF4G domain-containing protein 1
VVFSLLEHLKSSFSEGDVVIIVHLLHQIGFAVRSENAALMKDFVVSVHERAGQLGAKGELTQRARLMLDLVVDIKNNRKRSGNSNRRAASLLPHFVQLLKGSSVDSVSLHNLTWNRACTLHAKNIHRQ